MDKKDSELEFNKKNREEYEQLMEESSTKLDGYYDKNNWVVRIILLILFIIIVVGSYWIISNYFGSM